MAISATMSLWGLYQVDPTILDGLIVPTGMDGDNVKDNLLLETESMEILYPNTTFLKMAVTVWAAERKDVWDKLYATTVLDYNPIENYDRNEESESSNSGGASGSTTVTSSATAYNSDDFADAGKSVSSGKQYDINLYDVVVRAQDSAQTVTDLKGYTFAVQPVFRQEELASVIRQLEEELGEEVETVVLTSALSQAQALLEGEVDAVVYNDVFNSSIAEQLEGYEEQIRILDTYTVKTEAETVRAVDVDIKDTAVLVYISGTDSEGTISMTGRSDVNIVAGINTASKQIVLISIPRDYYVEFPGITAAGSRDKLTHAGIYGMDELIATVGGLLGHDINYYVRVNFSSMMDIVDAIGGVTVYNEQAFISHGGYYFPAGMVDMNGEYALHYVRERFAFEDGDFARGRNQIKVIRAMMDKLVSVNTLANYNSLMTAITNSVATNIPEEDLKTVVNIQLNQNPQWHVVSYQLLGSVMFQPCQSTGGTFLSVDMPYLESVENAQILLEQLFAGETLSEDLQLADNGQLTFITNPAN